MNKFTVTGRFVKEHDLKYSQAGKAILNNSIAVQDGYGDKKQTYYFNIVVWDKLAENLAQFTAKGSKVLLAGKITQRNYENKEGNKVNVIDLVVQEFELLDSKKHDDNDFPF